MFAYCNNNPIMGFDPCGTCVHNWKFYNCEKCDAFWNGVTTTIEDTWDGVTEWFVDAYDTITSVNQQQALLQAQITMQQNEMIANVAEATLDACIRAENTRQAAQRKEADMIMDLFSTPESASKTLGLVGSELLFIGCFWGGPVLNPIGSGLLFIAAIVAFG